MKLSLRTPGRSGPGGRRQPGIIHRDVHGRPAACRNPGLLEIFGSKSLLASEGLAFARFRAVVSQLTASASNPAASSAAGPRSYPADEVCGIWNDPATPMRERKRIARLLRTDVTTTRTSDTITAHVRLAGGQHRTLTLPGAGQHG